VRPTPDGTLLIANSGLEMVLEARLSGEIVRIWDTLGENPWERISPAIDYRKGVSTKPHRSHPNHLFYIDQDIWVTRFEQRDAICLTAPGRRIEIGVERVHDGLLHGGWLYFTTVDGHVAIADPQTLQVVELIDLRQFYGDDDLLGWCRGLLVEAGQLWVGFSRIRPTKIRANVSWVRQGFRRSLPTRIACFDLGARRRVAEIGLENYGLNAVFSILPGVDRAEPRVAAEDMPHLEHSHYPTRRYLSF
jgi:hypothetical protein